MLKRVFRLLSYILAGSSDYSAYNVWLDVLADKMIKYDHGQLERRVIRRLMPFHHSPSFESWSLARECCTKGLAQCMMLLHDEGAVLNKAMTIRSVTETGIPSAWWK